jgi:transcriptional regulator with XRE-family HTH domain
MITAAQMRAARALLNIDQRQLADLSGLSLPTIQRMEGSEDTIRGNVDSLMKLIGALEEAGIELINDGAVSHGGGRGVRLKETRRDKEANRRRGSTSSGVPGPRAA